MKKTRDAKLSLLLSMLGIANKRNKKNQDSRVFAEYSEFEENLVQTYLDESKPQINEDIDALLDNNNTEKESKALAKSILSELGYGDVMSEDDLNFIWKCTGAYLSRRSKYPNGPIYYEWTKEGGKSLDFGVIPWCLPSNAKVAIIGDWGTGLPDAEALLQNIIEEEKPDALIHLGDIYYSGTIEESKKNFLDVIRRVFKGTKHKCRIFNLAGNHDYYAFGEGFYEILPQLNKDFPNSTQQASYFSLRTDDGNWQLLGIDTGYNDGNLALVASTTVASKISESGLNWLKSEGPDLRVSEKVWVANQLSKHTGKTILLSHHQLFSAHEKLSNSTNKPYLNSRLDALFRPYFPKIAAWFWGHEHCLVLFEDNLLDLKKGRLIGCSAFQDNVNKNEDDAYFNRTHNDIRYLDAPNTPKLRKEKGYYYHGYAVIHFEGENATTKYYDYPADIHIKANLPKVRRLIHQENL